MNWDQKSERPTNQLTVCWLSVRLTVSLEYWQSFEKFNKRLTSTVMYWIYARCYKFFWSFWNCSIKCLIPFSMLSKVLWLKLLVWKVVSIILNFPGKMCVKSMTAWFTRLDPWLGEFKLLQYHLSLRQEYFKEFYHRRPPEWISFNSCTRTAR